ncbi:MAG: pseudouridine synthase [Fimbriimonas sp.]
METERLHVRIAHSGLCSRRAAEQLILEGRVSVNGDTVAELGAKVTEDDEVRVDGQPLRPARLLTVLLNKPRGVVTTMSDPQRRVTVVRYLPDLGVTLKPIGRLDMDSEGMLLLTNDGELANRISHPRWSIDKEYVVTVRGIPDEKTIQRLRGGIFIDGAKTLPAQVEIIFAGKSRLARGDRKDPKAAFSRNRAGSDVPIVESTLKFILHEGRKRQIRLMCEAVGHQVTSLKRVRVGPLKMSKLRPGECRLLSQVEVSQLRQAVGLEVDPLSKPKKPRRTPRTRQDAAV